MAMPTDIKVIDCMLGIPEAALVNFNQQYLGRKITDSIEVGPSRPAENVIGVDAISVGALTHSAPSADIGLDFASA